jgi:acetate kinase
MDELNGEIAGTAMPAAVLALNSGSSSLKFGLYRTQPSFECLMSGEAEWKGAESAKFWARDGHGDIIASEQGPVASQSDAMRRIASLLTQGKLPPPRAIGHRIVHGGAQIRRHVVIDETVFAQLEAASGFAPLHVPPALAVLRCAQGRFPAIPHIACLDTAFHAGLPDVARNFPLPKELQSAGIIRFGFHGLSCESILRRLQDKMPERLVIAHLGNGASITAVKNGRSVDTSMGLTPTGGVMMGTRCGDLDPGVVLYLLREKHLTAAQLQDLTDHRSGLLGISGFSSDMRSLHDAAPSSADARLAIEMFCYGVRKQIAAMAAALGGMDLLVFTGGIGENDAAVRSAICAGLSWLGIRIDPVRNATCEPGIGAENSRCAVSVVPSEEDEQIARHAWDLTSSSLATG